MPVTDVVILHHFGGSSRTWTEVVERLAKIDPSIRCLVPDLHGFGQAASRAIGGYHVDDYADEVAELVSAHCLTRYLLVGHSMGGKIALALASRRPSGLAGLLLAAPSPPSPEPIAEQDRNQLRQARENAATASQIVLKETAKPLSNAIYQRTISDIFTSFPDAWSAWLESGSREDLSIRMSEIGLPVFVLAGGRDLSITPSLLTREIIERIPGSRLAVVPDSGHLMPLDAPAALSSHIRECLRSLNGPPPVSTQRTFYPEGAVLALLPTDLVTEPTRQALHERLDKPPAQAAQYFEERQFRVLSAVCARLIPQEVNQELIDIAGQIDLRLASGEGNGWRYDSLPPDGDAYRIGLESLDETARLSSGSGFCELDPDQQDQLLSAVQRNVVAGGGWNRIPPHRFFEELLTEASEIFFSHPLAQDRIGFAGMADRLGWQDLMLNHLAPQEPRPLETQDA